MLKTYIGPEGPVEVMVAGNHIGSVDVGEAIFIDDELANSVTWPEDLWQDGAPKKRGKRKESDDGTGDDGKVDDPSDAVTVDPEVNTEGAGN